ncbi:MAG: hypothetical protein ATN36_00765 [Epulopiscium sp. Nele67-Bin005]|nr:MAG: hypothetical protein ATN36_00765 [Epulopiscium sp. Nele67-Bin005]
MLKLTSDYVFKTFLCKEENRAILARILEVFSGIKILPQEILIKNSEITKEDISMATMHMDILIQTEKFLINLEMQNDKKEDLINRSMAYLSSLFKQVRFEPTNYNDYTHEVQVIFFMNFKDITSNQEINYTLLPSEISCGNIRFIEMSKVDLRTNNPIQTEQDAWITFFKNPTNKYLQQYAKRSEYIMQALEALDKLSQDPDIVRQDEARQRAREAQQHYIDMIKRQEAQLTHQDAQLEQQSAELERQGAQILHFTNDRILGIRNLISSNIPDEIILGTFPELTQEELDKFKI